MKIAREIEDEVSVAAKDATLCFVLEWDEGPALDQAAAYESRSDRLAAISAVMSRIKGPVLEVLRDQPLADVNDLAGTGQAVVAAPAHLWRTLFEHPSLKAADLRILPNASFHTMG
jgi:hypothetical protein